MTRLGQKQQQLNYVAYSQGTMRVKKESFLKHVTSGGKRKSS